MRKLLPAWHRAGGRSPGHPGRRRDDQLRDTNASVSALKRGGTRKV